MAFEALTDSPDASFWMQKHKPTGNAIPMIFIVSAEGKEIYNKGGLPAGDGLKKLLMTGIAETGGAKKLPPLWGSMIAAWPKIETLLSHHRKAEAITMAAKFASLAPAHDKLGPKMEEWTKEAGGDLKTAQQQLASADEVLQGITGALWVQRVYGKLPGVKEPLEKLMAEVRSDEKKAAMLEQAQALDKARALEEREGKHMGLVAYRTVASRYAGTPAAGLAEKRIGELSPGGAQASAAKPAGSGSASSSKAAGSSVSSSKSADHKKAASYLSMARTFAATRPDKARQYAQKVLDLLPDSDEAGQARRLLQELGE